MCFTRRSVAKVRGVGCGEDEGENGRRGEWESGKASRRDGLTTRRTGQMGGKATQELRAVNGNNERGLM